MEDAFVDADIVIPKNWGGFFVSDNPDEIRAEQAKHKNWICTEELMKLTKKHSIYMHALPADRGKEVVDSVIDGPHSVVYDEAENRLHTAKAVMTLLMGGRF
jgi:ornithine carbamoyltransferase